MDADIQYKIEVAADDYIKSYYTSIAITTERGNLIFRAGANFVFNLSKDVIEELKVNNKKLHDKIQVWISGNTKQYEEIKSFKDVIKEKDKEVDRLKSAIEGLQKIVNELTLEIIKKDKEILRLKGLLEKEVKENIGYQEQSHWPAKSLIEKTWEEYKKANNIKSQEVSKGE